MVWDEEEVERVWLSRMEQVASLRREDLLSLEEECRRGRVFEAGDGRVVTPPATALIAPRGGSSVAIRPPPPAPRGFGAETELAEEIREWIGERGGMAVRERQHGRNRTGKNT